MAEIFSPASSGLALCGNSSCDMAFGDFTANWPRQTFPSARFSKPWMISGYQILARQSLRNDVRFDLDFISPFSASLWFAIFGMMVGLSFMATILENASFRKASMRFLSGSRTGDTPDQQDTEMNFKEGLWFIFQTLFSTQDTGVLESNLARVTVCCWQLSVVAILSMYTASYTNIIASSRIQWAIGEALGNGASAYTTLSAAVNACPLCVSTNKGGAAEKYLNRTLRMDFSKVQDEKEPPFPFASSSDTVAKIRSMMEDAGSLRSVWIEKSSSMKYITDQVVDTTTDKKSVCEWKALGAEFGTSAQAIPFSSSLPQQIADAIDTVISRLTDDLGLKSLENQWFPEWPDCLLIKNDTRKPMAPEHFTMLFFTVAIVALSGFVHRIMADYSITVQMDPENHTGALATFFKTNLGRLIFGVNLKDLDRPFTSHAILSEMRRYLMESNGPQNSAEWVRKYSRSNGVFFYVNNATGEYSWQDPEELATADNSQAIVAIHFAEDTTNSDASMPHAGPEPYEFIA